MCAPLDHANYAFPTVGRACVGKVKSCARKRRTHSKFRTPWGWINPSVFCAQNIHFPHTCKRIPFSPSMQVFLTNPALIRCRYASCLFHVFLSLSHEVLPTKFLQPPWKCFFSAPACSLPPFCRGQSSQSSPVRTTSP